MQFSKLEKWKSKVLLLAMSEVNGENQEMQMDEFNIVHCKLEESEALEFHEKHTKGAFLRKLKDVKNHQINWETPYYFKVFETFFGNTNLSDAIILDIGCGDGRITEYLLNKGANKIVCVDFDFKPLLSLSQYLDKTGQKSKVLLLHSDMKNMPLRPNAFDIVFALRSLYYLNEKYETLIKNVNDFLVSEGLFIVSDPNIEGYVLRALFFDSLNEALNTFEKRRFKEVQENTDYRFRAFTEKELLTIYLKAGFTIEGKHGITMWHNIIRVLLLRRIISENELDKNKSRLTNLFDFLDQQGSLFKDIVWKLKKTPIKTTFS